MVSRISRSGFLYREPDPLLIQCRSVSTTGQLNYRCSTNSSQHIHTTRPAAEPVSAGGTTSTLVEELRSPHDEAAGQRVPAVDELQLVRCAGRRQGGGCILYVPELPPSDYYSTVRAVPPGTKKSSNHDSSPAVRPFLAVCSPLLPATGVWCPTTTSPSICNGGSCCTS